MRTIRPTTSLMAVALATAALALALLLATGAPVSAASPKVVGKVVVIGGSKKLQTRATESGPLRRLKVGEALVLGEQVVMGPGVTATLRVARPKGVNASAELVVLTSAAGSKHKAHLSADGAYTVIKITSG